MTRAPRRRWRLQSGRGGSGETTEPHLGLAASSPARTRFPGLRCSGPAARGGSPAAVLRVPHCAAITHSWACSSFHTELPGGAEHPSELQTHRTPRSSESISWVNSLWGEQNLGS